MHNLTLSVRLQHKPSQGAAIDTSHLAGCTEENEVTWDAQALLHKAQSVLALVLGKRHHETIACHAYVRVCVYVWCAHVSIGLLESLVYVTRTGIWLSFSRSRVGSKH